MSYREVMELPIMTFWFMSSVIRRIRADAELRQLAIGVAAQSNGEGVKEFQERLVLEVGTVTNAPAALDTERDEEGFAELKAIAASM